MSDVVVLDQRPVGDVVPETPLHGSAGPVDAVSPARAGVLLSERGLLGHLVLRGNPGDEAFSGGIERTLGAALPRVPMTSTRGEKAEIQWLGPDEWLVLVEGGEAFVIETALREALNGHYSIVNVSGGQTVIGLSGPNARDVLMKSTVYDVHPAGFPVGKGVNTIFAKATALIRRPEADRWELVVRRSYADYIWRWLLDAGEEYGVSVA